VYFISSYVYGLYSFGLEETFDYDKASVYAKKSLDENRFDGWATHSLAHVFEMKGCTEEGLRFLDSTRDDWEKANHLAHHNYWHMALYHLEKEEWEAAVEVLDKEILPPAMKSKTLFGLHDCSSLLWRIEMLAPSEIRR
jgi:hypothetical protein